MDGSDVTRYIGIPRYDDFLEFEQIVGVIFRYAGRFDLGRQTLEIALCGVKHIIIIEYDR